jgi:hypothetical protein
MICENCRRTQHLRCPEWNKPNPTYCDCQHKRDGVNWSLIRKPDAQVADPTTKPVDCLD